MATPTFTQMTATRKHSGWRREDVNNVVQASFANPNAIEAEVITRPVKSTGHLFSGDN